MSERDTPILLIQSWCRNVTLRSINTILVSERDTRSINTILVSERDTRSTYTILVSDVTPDPLILSWCRNVKPDPLLLSWCWNVTLRSSTVLVSKRDTRSPNLILSVHQALFYTKASSLTKRFQGLRFNSLIMLILSQLYNHIMQAHN